MARLPACAPKLALRVAKLISRRALSRQSPDLGATLRGLHPLYMTSCTHRQDCPGPLCTTAVPAIQVCLAPLFLLFFLPFSSPVLIHMRGKGDLGSVQLKDDMHVLVIKL